MPKPIWLPNKLFYSKARLNIEPFKKVLKIKNKYRVAVQIQSIKKYIKPNKKKKKKGVVGWLFLSGQMPIFPPTILGSTFSLV